MNIEKVNIRQSKSSKNILDTRELTAIELFAGAGGLALGIEKAGFKTLGLIEFNKDAAKTLKTNRKQ